ncbi:hypothetical protein MRX96_006495 [Rhipicephalus microplus]
MWERCKLHNRRGHSYKTRTHTRKLDGRAEKGCVPSQTGGAASPADRSRVQLCKQRCATVLAPAAAVVVRVATWRAHHLCPLSTGIAASAIGHRGRRRLQPPLYEQTPFGCTSSLAASTKGLAGPPDGSRLRRRIDHRSVPPLFWLPLVFRRSACAAQSAHPLLPSVAPHYSSRALESSSVCP